MMAVNIIIPKMAYKVSENVSSPLKAGDVSSILIKERTGTNEATVILKGQELAVEFDGPMPMEDRALVEVTKQNDQGQWVVKPVIQSQSQTTANDTDNLMEKAGFDPTANPELKEAVNAILSKGGSVSKQTLENLQDFLTNEAGSLSEKLETIKIMQQKNIQFTSNQLNSVHLALHGKPLAELLEELTGPIEFTSGTATAQNGPTSLERAIDQTGKINFDAVQRVLSALDPTQHAQEISEIKKALQIIQAGKQRIMQALPNNDLKQLVEQEPSITTILPLLRRSGVPEKLLQDAVKLEKIGTAKLVDALQGIVTGDVVTDEQPDSVLQEITKLVQKEARMTKVLEGLQTFLEQPSKIDLSGLQKAFEKATELTQQGRELAARRELTTAINLLENINQKKNETTLSKAEQYYINETVQTLSLHSKNVQVTEITKKLSQMAIDFKKIRQEISRNLDSTSRLIEANKPGNAVPVKQMLEATIKKLDNTILKSDFMLYTDMTQEKEMLTASSKLAKARNLLSKGNFVEANQIVKEVKGSLDKLIFKPADNRVRHFVSDQELLTPKSMLEKVLEPTAGHEPGARQIFEKIRALGLTHEQDAAQAIIYKQDSPNNLKSVLLKMMDSNLDQAVSTITGQQLLNKQDSSGFQNLFLQLPILLNKQAENVKIFVNLQKQGEKIDWENCSLYFVLETKKLGDVGILISATNRNLSITVKNNRVGLEGMMKPLTEVAKGRLEEIGYNVGSIQFKPFTETIEQPVKKTTYSPEYTEKGYDFSI